MFKPFVLAVIFTFTMLSMQACFWSGPSGQYAPGPYASTHSVCDTNGNNCLICDDNNNCQRTDSKYGSSRHQVCDAQGNNCLDCDSNNSNCQSTARSYWGFIF